MTIFREWNKMSKVVKFIENRFAVIKIVIKNYVNFDFSKHTYF